MREQWAVRSAAGEVYVRFATRSEAVEFVAARGGTVVRADGREWVEA